MVTHDTDIKDRSVIGEICLKLGWKGSRRTEFDILPLVVQASGQDPEFFDIPSELVPEHRLLH